MFVQEQHWYYCYTCGLVESEGCCSVCVKVCHKGHEVAYARHGNFFCDCGAARSAQVRPRSFYVYCFIVVLLYKRLEALE
jgi:hypothetical protein